MPPAARFSSFRRFRFPRFRPALTLAAAATASLPLVVAGCSDQRSLVREIQVERQSRMQSQAEQDHLGEAFSLLQRLVTLNPAEARRQITYHLNRWSGGREVAPAEAAPPAILPSLGEVLPPDEAREAVLRNRFVTADVDHLRDAYLFRQVVEWVDSDQHDDPVLREWFTELRGEVGDGPADTLLTASRLFDWTVRNVAFEPLEVPPVDQVNPPPLPLGMKFQGPGYRRTDYLSLWRGLGDAWQRAGVFTQLCRQAGVPAAVLATQSTETGELRPWSVGVAAGEQVYLFEPGLGTFIPGPGQEGIATLEQARRQPIVMRRLNVPGFFDYPLGQSDIQQSIALLNVIPEGLSGRMRRLEQGLTGQRRLTLHVDAEAMSRRLDAITGIAGVRLWKVPVLARIYQAEIDAAAQRDPMLAFWRQSRWAIMDADAEHSRELARGRWRHLHGQFSDDETEDRSGARALYLAQRAPEFEIADLRIDVELQKQYGIRRQLGVDSEIYDRQVQQIQNLMRLGKRTATYWLSLLQYDDGRYETAANWFEKRVLDDERGSIWEPAARYNLARSLEHLGQTERAEGLYKTSGDPQEHGNRIRARLITRASSEASSGTGS